jgi:UDP-2,3-diacylglucosamine hydrolase
MSSQTQPIESIPKRIGLIAGQGDFPILLAQGARGAGVELVVFGVHGLASDGLTEYSNNIYSLKLTEMTRLFDLCRQHDIRHLIMAGRIPHKVLLKQISFDRRILKVLGNLQNKKADSLLLAATKEIEAEGIKVLDSTIFLQSCMPEPGLLTPKCPVTEQLQKNFDFAYPIAKEIAKLDVGQTIAVKNEIVVAVEGIEGTDHLIQRSGELAGEGVVFVKVSKPKQDMRFDVPVVGINTFRNMAKVKAAGLCVTAGQSIFLDREESLSLAEKSGICVYAWEEKSVPPLKTEV